MQARSAKPKTLASNEHTDGWEIRTFDDNVSVRFCEGFY
jgi:hypothetical protein